MCPWNTGVISLVASIQCVSSITLSCSNLCVGEFATLDSVLSGGIAGEFAFILRPAGDLRKVVECVFVERACTSSLVSFSCVPNIVVEVCAPRLSALRSKASSFSVPVVRYE